ncbi:MAG TPA: GreA/GreB family elongation factor [Candidatus Ozemobacteraceae bacterium]|nr:GreA/GreB family elongation factor [Candidatus Ozemobacteraceae bacterium]
MTLSMTIDRKVIIDNVVRQIEEQIAETFKSYQSNKDISINAPGKMESRYDTRKYEYGAVADGLAALLEQLQETLKSVKSLCAKPDGEKIQLGSFVLADFVRSTEQGTETGRILYMILSSLFDGNLQQVKIASASSPIGKALLGKKAGDRVSIEMGVSRRKKVHTSLRILEVF